jgi:protein phosphatase
MTLDGSGASRAAGDGFHNEDRFLVKQGLGLYLVCDGLSDSPAGEVAARIASQAVEAFVARAGEELDLERGWVAREVVERAMEEALAAVAAAEEQDPELAGLSTTVTMLLAHRHFGVIGHRGDSRAYLVRRDQASQLTFDHELTKAPENPGEPVVDFDAFSILLRPGDTIVLCTDGAESVIEDEDFVESIGELPPRIVASRIVSAAHQRSPDVDATAVVIRVGGDREPGWLELSLRPYSTSFGHALQVA